MIRRGASDGAGLVHWNMDRIRRSGSNVLVPEYLGYGLSEGKACEAACYDTADAVWRHVIRRKDVDKTKIVVSGASLGGAVAIDLAARVPVAGLITLVTFTSIPDVARHTLYDAKRLVLFVLSPAIFTQHSSIHWFKSSDSCRHSARSRSMLSGRRRPFFIHAFSPSTNHAKIPSASIAAS